MLTKEDIQRALPPNLKHAANDELVQMLNGIQENPEVANAIRENFISYAGVLKDGRFKTEDYLNAVAYCSFKIMGYSNQEAYEKTFPDRMEALLEKGTSRKDISAYVTAYHKGKLVTLILTQSLIPTWVLNQDAYQKAVNVQVELMTTSNSDLVRTQAANSLLTHLKKPDVKEFQISMEVKESSGMKEMQDAMRQLAERQRQAIEAGVSAGEIAAQRLIPAPAIEGEYTEVASDQTNAG